MEEEILHLGWLGRLKPRNRWGFCPPINWCSFLLFVFFHYEPCDHVFWFILVPLFHPNVCTLYKYYVSQRLFLGARDRGTRRFAGEWCTAWRQNSLVSCTDQQAAHHDENDDLTKANGNWIIRKVDLTNENLDLTII